MQFKYTPSSLSGMPSDASVVASNFQRAILFHQRGQLAPAQQAYAQVLKMQPNHAQALHLLGVLAFQTGNCPIAVDLIGKAISVDSNQAAFHCNLGNALLKLGQFDAAIASYDSALRIKPDFADAFGNRGVAHAEQRQFEAAIASYDNAIAANPQYAEAYSNRGTALLKLRRIDSAIASFDAAISLRQDYAEAHCARGIALQEQDRLDEAMASYYRALSANPRLIEAHCNLANTLMEQGRLDEALTCYMDALGIADTAEGKRGFVQCVKRVSFVSSDAGVRALLMRAISEAWTRPAQLLVPAISIVKLNQGIKACIDKASGAWPRQLSRDELFGDSGLSAVASDPMMRCILECMPVASIEMERFLSQTRRILLDLSLNTQTRTEEESTHQNEASTQQLALLCAIARQCYLNEYVFFASAEELAQVNVLREWLDAGVSARLPLSGHWLAAVAAYCPLESMQSADAISELAWTGPVLELIKQQVREPATEKAYRPLIPRLTAISNSLSLLVQKQYEENPYPRWVKTTSSLQMECVDTYLRQLFPNSPIQPFGKNGCIEILIAGCGTGQQSVDTALLFPAAKLLAIDLSLSSLCYAKRKTDELGLRNIDYAQADIMALGSINQTFDVIESVGVLHHLADPLAGWRVLLGLLRPGGFMRLGFYSELARQNIVEARVHIATHGYAANATDIRQCRQDLMSAEYRNRFGNVFSFRDFFGTSECRDLLFHVQEHRFTALEIKGCLEELGLSFVGFNIEVDTLAQYRARFPEDMAQTNLENWHLFEIENPTTFANMYQFWVQKTGRCPQVDYQATTE